VESQRARPPSRDLGLERPAMALVSESLVAARQTGSGRRSSEVAPKRRRRSAARRGSPQPPVLHKRRKRFRHHCAAASRKADCFSVSARRPPHPCDHERAGQRFRFAVVLALCRRSFRDRASCSRASVIKLRPEGIARGLAPSAPGISVYGQSWSRDFTAKSPGRGTAGRRAFVSGQGTPIPTRSARRRLRHPPGIFSSKTAWVMAVDGGAGLRLSSLLRLCQRRENKPNQVGPGLMSSSVPAQTVAPRRAGSLN
jgi:hypothetical protein